MSDSKCNTQVNISMKCSTCDRNNNDLQIVTKGDCLCKPGNDAQSSLELITGHSRDTYNAQCSVTLYCTVCAMFTCLFCTSEGNRHHSHLQSIVNIKDYFESNVDQIKAKLPIVVQDLEKHVQTLKVLGDFLPSVSDCANSFISKLNDKLNQLVNTIETIRTNLVLATLQHAQMQQAKAATMQDRRKFGKLHQQRHISKRMYENLSASQMSDFKEAEYWAGKCLLDGYLTVKIPSSGEIKIPSTLEEIVENQVNGVKQTLDTTLKNAELLAGYSTMNKRLMVVGGHLQYGASIYNRVKDSWYTTAPMNNQRWYSAAAVTWNGTVVVTGGFNPFTASVEQFNPKTNQWTALPDLQVARCGHALVSIGSCLYAIGGQNEKHILRSVEKYSAGSKTWKTMQQLPTCRASLTCAKYKKTALLIGGMSAGHRALSRCDLFVPSKDQYIVADQLNFPRLCHAAATYGDMVFVFGGRDKLDLSKEFSCVAEVEQYNWRTNKWTVLQSRMAQPRFDLAAVCLNDCIYVVGGCKDKGETPLNEVECFDVRKENFSSTAPLPMRNASMVAVSVPVVNVRKQKLPRVEMERPTKRTSFKTRHKQLLLCVGGGTLDNDSCTKGTKAAIYDCNTDKWRPIAPTNNKHSYTAAVTWKGTVVVAGGNFPVTNSVELYDPETDTWTSLPNLLVARRGHSLVNMNGRLYVIGGSDGKEVLSSVELYDTGTKTWINQPTLCGARKQLACALCQKGIVATGGGDKDKDVLSSCELFSAASCQWSPIAPLNIARGKHAAAMHNYTVYVFGGWDGIRAIAEIEQYKADANKWTLLKAQLSLARCELAAACVQSRIYILGGMNKSKNEKAEKVTQKLDAMDCFDPAKKECTLLSKLPQALRAHAAACCSLTVN